MPANAGSVVRIPLETLAVLAELGVLGRTHAALPGFMGFFIGRGLVEGAARAN